MVPAHLLGDDLVAVRVVEIFFEQLHVLFRFPILLLEKAFPIVFIPDPLLTASGLEMIIGHIVCEGYLIPARLATKCRLPRTGGFALLFPWKFGESEPLARMKLLLIDGSYYAYRSFHAIRGLTNSQGEPTNAIFGFAKTVRRMIKDLRPDLAAVCWDEGLPARRTELQPEYKQHRSEMPPEMVPQIPFIRDLVPKLGLHGVSLPDTEADDLMASYSCAAHSRGMEVILATNDKDLLSLVEDDILVYSTAKADLASPEQAFTLLDPAAISKKWGVQPARILDVLALSGRRQRQHRGRAGGRPENGHDADSKRRHARRAARRRGRGEKRKTARQARRRARANPAKPRDGASGHGFAVACAAGRTRHRAEVRRIHPGVGVVRIPLAAGRGARRGEGRQGGQTGGDAGRPVSVLTGRLNLSVAAELA